MAFAQAPSTTVGMQTIDMRAACATPSDLQPASGAPVWSPDGKRIAYIAGAPSWAAPARGARSCSRGTRP